MRKAAFLLFTAIMLAGLCGCGKSGGGIAGGMTESLSVEENYFGGEGELKAFDGGYEFYDNDSVYSHFGELTLKKYNKKTGAFYTVCDDPDCDHLFNDRCKANTYYCVFRGDLINVFNEKIVNSDGTVDYQGYLYRCGDGKKEIFKNENPEGVDPERDDQICFAFTLGDDYLVLSNGVYIYILDTDYSIKYTILNAGRNSGGIYYVNDQIYYIDNLFRFQKLDPESGESSPVDLGGMKVWEAAVTDNVLWFNNGDAVICTYDFKTGEVRKRIEGGVGPIAVGKYIEYYNTKGTHYYDPESGETVDWGDEFHYMTFFDGIYYNYNIDSGKLTLYEEDLSTVIKSCALS